MPAKKARKISKGAWFVPVRRSYLPCSWQGWVSYIPYVVLLLIPFAFELYFWKLCDGFGRALTDQRCGLAESLGNITRPHWVGMAMYYAAIVLLMNQFAKSKS